MSSLQLSELEYDVAESKPRARFEFAGTIPFVLIHLAALVGGILVEWTAEAIGIAVVSYWARMFGVTAGYHRYFSHRTFKLSRLGQFLMALLAQSSAQRGALWWAAHHRHHHKHSDAPDDVHSPVQRGFWYSHVGWIFSDNSQTHSERIKDLTKYPELVWLDRYHHIPAIALALFSYWLAGASGLFIGFFMSTVVLWHATFTINSLSHVWGSRRYETTDDSRNNAFLAFITLGEGWHNNHHHYQASVRQGFAKWEIDLTYLTLKVMEKLRLVSELREPPERIMAPFRSHQSGAVPRA